jgi:CxxC motif-containing protein
MICETCSSEYDSQQRNLHLPDNSSYKISNLCMDCILQELATIKNNLYPTLVKTSKVHSMIKTTYHKVTAKLTEINNQFKAADYERNIILHNIRTYENHIKLQQKQAERKSTKVSKTPIDKETIIHMLNNLPASQRDAIMANFLKESTGQA